ncbi:hypothetical protein CTI12_AA200610 [Artemisia annua]|uniref:Zinc finger, CCHC-type n=1 Tax=Artemisia annua TaxID=35608 RepID=A0A2U1P055_ARTAN|nr:hypothetical protein CTI12_AA200610 [Artemisia annua]
MTPELQKNLEHFDAYDMLMELNTMFAQQAKQDLFKTMHAFHACKHEEDQSVSTYVLKMKGYLDRLERLGHPMSSGLAVSMILTSLNKDFARFRHNYNIQCIGNPTKSLFREIDPPHAYMHERPAQSQGVLVLLAEQTWSSIP